MYLTAITIAESFSPSTDWICKFHLCYLLGYNELEPILIYICSLPKSDA